MKITETNLEGCFIVEFQIFDDERGLFFESYHKKKFEQAIGQDIDFVQDNQSISKKGVLRGLHFQEGDFAQSKWVRVVKGEVLDVAVDLRPESNTFGQYFKIHLSEENNRSLFIPKGMAHGFLTLSEQATFVYKCDAYYHKPAENGILWNDETLQIDWQLPASDILLSEKDAVLPTFKELFS